MESRPAPKAKETLISLTDAIFQQIYDAAKQKNKSALQRLVEAGYCLEITRHSQSPAGLLALEGDHDSVNFLKNEFKVDIDFILKAYALAGDTERSIELMRAGANPSQAGMSFAERNNGDMVAFCELQGAANTYIMMGYAAGQQSATVKRLAQYCGPIISIEDNFPVITVHGWMDYRVAIPSAAYMYAFKGYDALLEDLLIFARHLDEQNGASSSASNRYKGCLENASKGYAQARRLDKAAALVQRGAPLDSLVSGSAVAGDTESTEKYIKAGGSVEAAIYGYYNRYCFATAETTLQLLAFTHDADIRRDIAVKAKASNIMRLSFDPVSLLPDAERLHSLMIIKELDYLQAKHYLAAEKRQGQGFFANVHVTAAETVTVKEEYDLTLQHRR